MKGKIPILHLINTLGPGGAENMLSRLVASMDQGRFLSQIICLSDVVYINREIKDKGIPVHTLNMPRGRLTPGGLVKLWRMIRSFEPAILQTWMYHSDFLGLIFGKLANVKHVCWNIRCSYIDLGKHRPSTKWTIRLCSLLSSLPQVIIANSRAALEYHVALGYKAKGWQVIPNGFDLHRFKPEERAKQRLLTELGLANDKKDERWKLTGPGKEQSEVLLIGFVAREHPMKDHATFFKAASLLLRKMNNVHFVLAGHGVDSENKKLAAQLPNIAKQNFHLLGERSNIEAITAGLDIASLVSLGEGFPNTVGEAMACGVPCVVTDVGDAARIVDGTGYVVPPGDPEALARAWKELIDMGPERRRKLGLAAREHVTTHFELSQVVRAYEILYESLTAD